MLPLFKENLTKKHLYIKIKYINIVNIINRNNLTDMKAEFELNIDNNGSPCIKFKYYDKDNSIEQKLLKVFLEGIKEKGCFLKCTGGYAKIGTSESWEIYEIQIGN